jgi:hypothetical protein
LPAVFVSVGLVVVMWLMTVSTRNRPTSLGPLKVPFDPRASSLS